MSTMLMETMTIGPSVENTMDGMAPKDLDIDHVSRKKIVIKPRCKEYVKKQRSLKPTLACFTSSAESTFDARHSLHPTSSIEPATLQASLGAQKVASTVDSLKSASRKERVENVISSKQIYSGRIEKPTRKTPVVKILAERKTTLPPNTPSMPRALRGVIEATPRTIESATDSWPICICPDPKQCARCRLQVLVDRFCNIVAARKQLLKKR